MYKILVYDADHNVQWWEYGFSHYLMKRINFLYNYANNNFEWVYEIKRVERLVFSFPVFWKCLCAKTTNCYNAH